MKEGGREAQDAALLSPEAYDEETRSLFEWVTGEIERRTADGVGASKHAPEGNDDATNHDLLLAASKRTRKPANGAAHA